MTFSISARKSIESGVVPIAKSFFSDTSEPTGGVKNDLAIGATPDPIFLQNLK